MAQTLLTMTKAELQARLLRIETAMESEYHQDEYLALCEKRDAIENELDMRRDADDAQYDPHDFEDIGGIGVEPR